MSDRAVTEKIIQALADYLKRDPKSIKPKPPFADDLGPRLDGGHRVAV